MGRGGGIRAGVFVRINMISEGTTVSCPIMSIVK